MRLLIVNPAVPPNLHCLTEAADIAGVPAFMPNLALPTLAALAPADVEVTLADEAVAPVDLDTDCDVVAITGYITQRGRMAQLAAEFRRRGRLVVIGGPYASLSPQRMREHADVLFIGEAEETWPRFLADYRSGTWQTEYRATRTIALDESPAPAMHLLQRRDYSMGVVQTSRGCPFECEFCDVIVYLGRKQRHKSPERVVAELETLHRLGYRRVFLSDDNLTAHRARARAIMQAVANWQRTKPERVFLVTQLSIDVARDRDLLGLCADAGLQQVFIGIETSDVDALREVKKRQNVRANLVDDIQTFFRHGISVQAGMITGFDHDRLDAFERQFRFAQQSGLPTLTAGVLNAPDGTALERRLRAEGRIDEDAVCDVYLGTNIVPKQMSRAQLIEGARWLLNALYIPDAFLARLKVMASHLPDVRSYQAGDLRGAMLLWQRVVAGFTTLGPEFVRIPREAARLFRGKSMELLSVNLVFYKHIISVLRAWGAWDPVSGRGPAPFSGATAGGFGGSIGGEPLAAAGGLGSRP